MTLFLSGITKYNSDVARSPTNNNCFDVLISFNFDKICNGRPEYDSITVV